MKTQKRFKKPTFLKSIVHTISAVALLLVMTILSIPQSMCKTDLTAKAFQIANSSQTSDTTFLFEPHTSVTTSADVTVTLDTKTGNLVTLSDGRISQGNVSNAHGATNLFSLGDYLVLVNLNETTDIRSKIMVLDAQNHSQKQELNIDESCSSILAAYDNVKATKHGGVLHLLFLDSTFEKPSLHTTISKPFDQDVFALSEPVEISFTEQLIQNNLLGFSSLDITVDPLDNKIHAVVHSSDSFFAFELPETSGQVANISTDENNLSLQIDNFHTFVFDNKTYIILKSKTTDEIACHSFSVSNDSFSIAEESESTLQTGLQTIDSITTFGGICTLTSKTEQKVLTLNVGIESEKLQIRENKLITNPEITLNFLDAGEILFAEVTSSPDPVVLRKQPFSAATLTELPAGTKLVVVAKGTFQNGTNQSAVGGYEYCFTTNSHGANFAGWIEIDKITDLVTNEPTERTYVYVRNGSQIFKYPSRTTTQDDINEVIFETNQIMRLEVNRDISSFSYVSGNATNAFFEVKVNGTVGYVEASNVQNQNASFVQTNAVVIRTSVVYATQEAKTDDVVAHLSEATRVRILENRNGNEKYTKIAFNDKDGNYFTGYILSENIKADAWSTMQLIGLILVILSVVFLVIILIVKNKINHE